MISHVDAHRPESVCELSEVEHLVAILVQFLKKVNSEILQGREFLSRSHNLSENVVKAGLREDLAVFLHVLSSVFISGDKHELKTREENSATNQEVGFAVVVASNGVLLLFSLNERTSDTSGVLVTDLVDVDGVVTAVIRDDECARLVIRLCGDETGIEAKNVHVLLKHFFHVKLGGLSLESDDRTHGVFFGTVASVGGNGLVKDWGCGLLEGNSALLHVAVLSVPCLCEVIGIVDKALTTPNVNSVAAIEILGGVELFWPHVHARAMGKNGGLGELLALEEFGEGIVARVGFVDFLDFNGVV